MSETILFVFKGTMHTVLSGNFGKETQEKTEIKPQSELQHAESISLLYITLLIPFHPSDDSSLFRISLTKKIEICIVLQGLVSFTRSWKLWQFD